MGASEPEKGEYLESCPSAESSQSHPPSATGVTQNRSWVNRRLSGVDHFLTAEE
jgi:hypothetical protein